MGGNRRTNKAKNQRGRQNSSENAVWFDKGKRRNRKRDKIAKASRRMNR